MSGEIGRFAWERALRVLRLPSTTKLVALMLATYASRDGNNIRPGEDRLAADCALTTRAVRTHIAALRDLGLIERTRRGSSNQHHRSADTYALRMPDNIADKVEILHDYPGLGLDRNRKTRSGSKPTDTRPATGTTVPLAPAPLPERNDRATGT